MYETLKVFDCQDMPDDIESAFFDYTDWVSENDVFIEWYTGEYDEEDEDGKKIDDWFVANGAQPHEKLIVKRWW